MATFGNTNPAGGLIDVQNRHLGCKFQAPEDGSITHLTWWTDNNDIGSADMKVAVYDNSLNLLGQGQGEASKDGDWATVELDSPVDIVENDYYYFAISTFNSCYGHKVVGDANQEIRNYENYSTFPDDPFPNPGYSARMEAVYATYTPSGDPPEKASNPSPADTAEDIDADTSLSWDAGEGADTHKLYFDEEYVDEVTSPCSRSTYHPLGYLDEGEHTWRIDEVNENGTTTGDTWSFTVKTLARNLVPVDAAVNIEPDTNLTWDNDAKTTAVDVYFCKEDEVLTDHKIIDGQLVTSYNLPSDLVLYEEYKWRIDCVLNGEGVIEGDQYDFRVRTPNIDISTLEDPLFQIRIPLQRKAFYAKRKYWAFYCKKNLSEETVIFFSTSSDCVSWASGIELSTEVSLYAAYEFSVWLDGNYVHLVYGRQTSGWTLYYQRGSLLTNGTIDWDAVQEVHQNPSIIHADPVIVVDSNGYPWIAWTNWEPSEDITVVKSSTKDGTWTEDFSNTLETPKAVPQLIPLTDGKVYLLYGWKEDKVYGRLYNGSWGAQETITAYNQVGTFMGFNGVAIGDDVHLVYLADNSGTYQIRYSKRTYGVGWGDEVLTYDNSISTAVPVLSYNSLTSDLYCFWLNSPTTDHVYYKDPAIIHGDGDPTDWKTEGDISSAEVLTASYTAYGGKILLLYQTESASYVIKGACLDFGDLGFAYSQAIIVA